MDETNIAICATEKATRYSSDGTSKSTIDLVLSKQVHITKQRVYEDMDSDHRPMSFEIKSIQTEINPLIFSSKNFAEANWGGV